MRLLLLALFLVANTVSAEPAGEIIQNLIAEAWKPLEVRVEWTFRKSSKQDLNPAIKYQIARPEPTRLAGNMILRIEGIDSTGSLLSIPVSGEARIFGESYTVNNYTSAGKSIDFEEITQVELEWTRLNDLPITEFKTEADFIAARGLIPGRTICQKDLKPAPVIIKDQPVTLELSDNSITISLVGRALKDGSIGEEIPVAVELSHTKRYRGIVVNEKTVRFIQ